MTRVLNTRPVEQAAELSQLLTAAGFEVVEAPAIAIVPAWNPVELERVGDALAAGAYGWVVLASQNAASGLDLSAARLVCGASTALALGVRPIVALDRFSAAAALEALRARVVAGDRVLAPRAAEGRDELVEGLGSLGIEVDAPVAYRTVGVDAATRRLGAGDIDVVTLCSPSAARSVASAVDARTRVVCLGATTASAVRELGVRVDGVAAATTMHALVACVSVAVEGVRV